MILVGNQRAGGQNLASHLLKEENDHIELHELRGFVADDLHGAFKEAHAISKGTQCKQYLFSLSLNPPENVSTETFIKAADEAEKRLGLEDQPRAIVFHEKEGRRHAHVVWSRIDSENMKAINHSWYKNKLNALSKEIYLENDWQLPNGYKDPSLKNPLNFTLAEFQQAQRTNRDPREIKQAFRQAWEQSDNATSLKAALMDKGFMLAKGDRRGFVAVDYHGEVYALAKWTGIKAREVKQRLGSPKDLPSVTEAKDQFKKALTPKLNQFITEQRQQHAEQIKPLLQQRRQLAQQHKQERQTLKAEQTTRWQAETQTRQSRLHTGLKGLWHWLSGKAKETRKQNQLEAYQSFKRDQSERDSLIARQIEQKQKVQSKINDLRSNQLNERSNLTDDIAFALRVEGRRKLIKKKLTLMHASPQKKHELTL